MEKFKVGDIVRHFQEDSRWNWRIDKIVNGRFGDLAQAVLVDDVNETYRKGYKCTYLVDFLVLVRKKLKRTKQTRVNKLYLASQKDGATHKGLVNIVNSRGIKSLGLTPTQAISLYEDNHGKKIPSDQILVWSLEPHTVRVQKNGKFRVSRKVK